MKKTNISGKIDISNIELLDYQSICKKGFIKLSDNFIYLNHAWNRIYIQFQKHKG